MALDKVKDDMLQDNLVFPGSTTQFPSVTTTQRDALSGVQPGTMIYNSTIGNLQQYTATGWASIAARPSITSLTYPTESGAVLTALDADGSSDAAQNLIINGSNFTSSVTVEIQVSGSFVAFASSTSVNGARTQITCTGVTKRAAADGYVLKVTNTTGLDSQTTVNFSADPSFSTAANLGTVFAGSNLSKSIAFTGTKVFQGATAKPTWMTVTGNTSTAEDGDGQTAFDATGSPVTLGGTAVNTGVTQNFTFSIIVRDAENQTFNRDYTLTVTDAPTGGTITTYTGYRVHSYTTVGTNQGGIFTLHVPTTIDILIIAGGGAGSRGTNGGAGGGAGGMRVLTSQSLNAGTFNVVVGAGGAAPGGANSYGSSGGTSSLIQATGTGSFSSSATGGGRAGVWNSATQSDRNGANGGSGGGAGETYGTGSSASLDESANSGGTGDGAIGTNGNTAGYYGGDGGDTLGGSNVSRFSGAGGGGAGGDGANGAMAGGVYIGALGGIGLENSFRTGSAVKYAGGGAGNGDASGYQSGGGIPFGGGTSPGGANAGGNGAANTGGGGGGGASGAGTGGSGIVVIRYAV